MKKIFIKTVILICLPIMLNIAITVYCFLNRSLPEFKGYFIGTMLSMFFSFVWVFIARKAIISNIMVMFTITLASFPIKIIFLAIIALGGLFLLKMNHIYFGFAFLLGTILSLFIEVWFLISANKLQRKLKLSLKATEKEINN
ncbi:MAG: hypothetical protein A2176_03850 [Spirochaetes bacterium RBG_13_51_14]|nr:MAG: hypothetical protein A2176_03850 [Spirochaetes bacterium RBG_13_51_14]